LLAGTRRSSDEAGLFQEIVWEMVLELKQLAGDTEIKKE